MMPCCTSQSQRFSAARPRPQAARVAGLGAVLVAAVAAGMAVPVAAEEGPQPPAASAGPRPGGPAGPLDFFGNKDERVLSITTTPGGLERGGPTEDVVVYGDGRMQIHLPVWGAADKPTAEEERRGCLVRGGRLLFSPSLTLALTPEDRRRLLEAIEQSGILSLEQNDLSKRVRPADAGSTRVTLSTTRGSVDLQGCPDVPGTRLISRTARGFLSRVVDEASQQQLLSLVVKGPWHEIGGPVKDAAEQAANDAAESLRSYGNERIVPELLGHYRTLADARPLAEVCRIISGLGERGMGIEPIGRAMLERVGARPTGGFVNELDAGRYRQALAWGAYYGGAEFLAVLLPLYRIPLSDLEKDHGIGNGGHSDFVGEWLARMSARGIGHDSLRRTVLGLIGGEFKGDPFRIARALDILASCGDAATVRELIQKAHAILPAEAALPLKTDPVTGLYDNLPTSYERVFRGLRIPETHGWIATRLQAEPRLTPLQAWNLAVSAPQADTPAARRLWLSLVDYDGEPKAVAGYLRGHALLRLWRLRDRELLPAILPGMIEALRAEVLRPWHIDDPSQASWEGEDLLLQELQALPEWNENTRTTMTRIGRRRALDCGLADPRVPPPVAPQPPAVPAGVTIVLQHDGQVVAAVHQSGKTVWQVMVPAAATAVRVQGNRVVVEPAGLVLDLANGKPVPGPSPDEEAMARTQAEEWVRANGRSDWGEIAEIEDRGAVWLVRFTTILKQGTPVQHPAAVWVDKQTGRTREVKGE
jgi:hypothetical protein